MTTHVPYADLPLLGDDLKIRHAWDFWGPDNRVGALARLNPATKLAALSVPKVGRCVSLSLPLGEPDPPLFERPPMRHTVFARDRNILEDRLDDFDMQASSQWDSMRHLRARQYGVFNAPHLADEAEVGIHAWVAEGFVARAVLLDLPRSWTAAGRDVDPLACARITVEDLVAAAESQRSQVLPGDLLLVRTGWMAGYRQSDGTPAASIGLEATEDMAAHLWDLQVCAVAADNPALEPVPADPGGGFLHRLILPTLGINIGELWDLEELARLADELGTWTSCVVSIPLNLPGGVGSPCNAMAIV